MYENQEEQVNLPACAVILMTLFPFIKQNYERFKLAEFLSEKKPTQRDIVENQFKECIHSIISWKSKNKISDWAIDQKKHGYPALFTEKVEDYWLNAKRTRTLRVAETAVLEETNAYNKSRLKVAETIGRKALSVSDSFNPTVTREEVPAANNDKRHRETETETEEETDEVQSTWNSFDSHKRRKYKYNYLTDDMDLSCEVRDPWIIDGLDITSLLMKYRQISIAGAKAGKNISDNRVLSLSYIFFVSRDQHRSCTHRFLRAEHKAIADMMNFKQHWMSLPFETRLWCAKLDQQILACPSTVPTKALRRTVREFAEEADNQADEEFSGTDHLSMMASLLTELVDKFVSWMADCCLESTFINQHMMPFLQQVFNKDEQLCGRLGESHLGDNRELMADYTVSHQAPDGRCFDLLAVEIKPPGKSSNCQVQSDFIKMGKEMKCMLDCLINAGVDAPVTCGLLVEGFKCTTYSMQLKADGVYLMVEHGQSHLLQTPLCIPNVPGIVEHLLQLKSLLSSTLDAIDTLHTHTARPILSWKRRSSGTPVKGEKK